MIITTTKIQRAEEEEEEEEEEEVGAVTWNQTNPKNWRFYPQQNRIDKRETRWWIQLKTASQNEMVNR